MTPEPTEPGGLLIGYARVSTDDQNLALQLDALRAAGVHPDHIHTDTASGANLKRPGLEAAFRDARRGDVFVIWKLDRLGRSLIQVVQTCETLERRGIGIHVLTEPIDTRTATGRFVLHILAAMAQMERDLIRERTKAGLDAARKRGAKPGQPAKMTPERQAQARALLAEGKSKMEASRRLGVSYTTLHKWLRAERDRADLAEGN